MNPRSADAVARLFDVKGRAADQAVPLIAADSAQVAASLGEMPALLASLGAAFWPGPLTVLVHAPGWLAPAVSAGTGRVGIRVPAHDVARALASAAGGLITATSANRSGAPATDDPDAVAQSIGDAIDVLVDSGRTPGGPPSTIVDITAGDVRLVRQGAVSWDEVLRCAARK